MESTSDRWGGSKCFSVTWFQSVFGGGRLQIPAALNLLENQCDGGAGVACVGAINAISAHLLQSDGHQALLMATD